MIENNYFSDNPDLTLIFDELVRWDQVVEASEGGFRDAKEYKETENENLAYAPSTQEEALEYYRSILDATGDLMGTYVAPRAAEMDKIGLKYAEGKVTYPQAWNDCYNKFREAGLQPTGLSRKYGGMALPVTAQVLACEIAARADSAFCLGYASVNVAEVVERFGSKEMCDEWIPQLASGDLCCAMALTEPNYGSNLPGVQTKAVKDENGNWKLTGAKRFITHASGYIDAPSVILTLARTGSPESGARGLSFFLVKGEDVFVAGVEKKMGLHCSPTCEVVYEDSPGLLIGEVGKGLVKYSMGMMNAARLNIGAQALGVAEAAFREGAKYANEREQFGKLIKDIPAVRKMLDNMERENMAMRLMLVEGARVIDRYMWKKHHMIEDGATEKEANRDPEIRFNEKLADFYTPLVKYYCSEGCLEVASQAMQIHGGSGYTEEYDVARIYRDARITTIYEGTTQLQVVAAIGGLVSGMTETGTLRKYIDESMSEFSPSPELLAQYKLLENSVQAYKSIESHDAKATVAFEAVENAARFLGGLLYEQAAARLKGENQKRFLKLSRAYQIDSRAKIEGNLVRLEAATRSPVTAQA